jgi:hypothetical protein
MLVARVTDDVDLNADFSANLAPGGLLGIFIGFYMSAVIQPQPRLAMLHQQRAVLVINDVHGRGEVADHGSRSQLNDRGQDNDPIQNRATLSPRRTDLGSAAAAAPTS